MELSPRHHEHRTELPKTPEPSQETHETQSAEPSVERDHFAESLKALQERVDTQATSGKDASLDYTTEHSSNNSGNTYSLGMHQQLKNDAYKRTLTKVRSHLSAPERTLSRAIHQPAVEAISEGISKTIGRPYALLFGGIATLLGTIVVLYFAKHTGFRYNYTIFFLLFIGGFFVGLFAELASKLPFFRKHNKR